MSARSTRRGRIQQIGTAAGLLFVVVWVAWVTAIVSRVSLQTSAHTEIMMRVIDVSSKSTGEQIGALRDRVRQLEAKHGRDER